MDPQPDSRMDPNDPNQTMPPPPLPRSRRRPQPGAEHVKHRRTRSGCYTCRQRRVKCDEVRPVCDRCRKGNRDCVYPGARRSSSNTASRSDDRTGALPEASSPSGSSDADADDVSIHEESTRIPASHGERGAPSEPASRKDSVSSIAVDLSNTDLAPESPTSARPYSRRQQSRTQSWRSGRPSAPQIIPEGHASPDVEFYLSYFTENMTAYHYGMRYDSTDFLHTTLVNLALQDGGASLLYGILSFAAFHHTIARNEGKISSFLSFYNRSIMHLQQSLVSKQHNIFTLMTILQLATIEEFLGDWVNLLSHQRAARQVISSLYTPQTIMQDDIGRWIMNWYGRFEIMTGFMTSMDNRLTRDWFVGCANYHEMVHQTDPSNLHLQCQSFFAHHQVLVYDLASLLTLKTKHAITDHQFATEAIGIDARLKELGSQIHAALPHPAHYHPSTSSSASAGDLQEPFFLFNRELILMDLLRVDFGTLQLAFDQQTRLALGGMTITVPPETSEIVLGLRKVIDALEYSNDAPVGAFVACQSVIGMLCLVQTGSEEHVQWCRSKLTAIENMGYFYPESLHKRLSTLWNVDVSTVWLPPQQGDLDRRSIRAVRSFIEYRDTHPTDAEAVDMQEINGVFRLFQLEDS